MRKIYYILMFCLFVFVKNGRPQSIEEGRHYTDSMEVLLKSAKRDTAKVVILNKLSDYWSEKDSAKSVQYALRALQISKGCPFYNAAAHFYLGGSYFYNDPSKSKTAYLATIDLLKKDSSGRSLSLLGRAWHNYGALLQREGDNKAFMAILLNHTIPIAKMAEDTLHEADDYFSVAQVFSNIFDYDKAIVYYQKAIQLLKELHKPSDKLASFYTNLAKTYIYNKTFPPAKPYLDSAQKILSNLPPSFDQVELYMTLGMYYSHTHQWKQAFDYLDRALSLAQTLYLRYEANSVLFQKFKAYTEAKLYPQAKQVLLQVYHDPISSSNSENKLMFLYNLAQTDAKMGNMKSAYGWLSQYALLADSLNDKKIKTEIAGLEIKYESEKKQREILSLQNENKKQQLTLQHNRFLDYFLIAGIVFLILISLLIYILYNNKRRRAGQEAVLHRQQIRQIAQENQLKVYNAVLEGQEQERRRMAQDLHDGLGGMLAGVKLKLSDIAENHQPEKDMELYKVISQLDNSVQELRRIARNMMPETLIRFGVETALRDLCESLQTPFLRVEFQSYQLSRDMAQPVQITLYRIVQELLTNAVKHAGASNILVQCSQNSDRIFITVEDDGQGFDVNLLKAKKGIGLSNIQNRINLLKGKLDIQTKLQEGTTVNVEMNENE